MTWQLIKIEPSFRHCVLPGCWRLMDKLEKVKSLIKIKLWQVLFKLHLIQLIIIPFTPSIPMGAHFFDLAFIQHNDLIGFADS